MTLRTSYLSVFLFLVFSGSITTAVHAHKGASGIVKERMDAMSAVAKDMKAIAPMMRGKAPFDASVARRHAGSIRRLGEKMPAMFPKGSIHGPSESTPNIWTDWDTFRAHFKDLETFAGLLENHGKEDVAAAQDAFRKLSGTCLACHKSFRVKKK